MTVICNKKVTRLQKNGRNGLVFIDSNFTDLERRSAVHKSFFFYLDFVNHIVHQVDQLLIVDDLIPLSVS